MTNTASPTLSGPKFSAGERVLMRRASTYVGRTAPGPFTIVDIMPGSASGCFYRIKADSEKHERVAAESQLDPVA